MLATSWSPLLLFAVATATTVTLPVDTVHDNWRESGGPLPSALASTAYTGLLATTLDAAGACTLYEAHKDHPQAMPAARLRLARCRAALDATGAANDYLRVLKTPLGQTLPVLHEVSAFVVAHQTAIDPKAAQALQAGLLPALDVEVSPFDPGERNTLAEVLVLLHQSGGAHAQRAKIRLQELDDTPAAHAFAAAPPTTLAQAYQRAQLLDTRQDSQGVLDVLAPFVDDKKADKLQVCEARLLMAKTWRKQRKRARAQREITTIEQQCGPEVKKRAAYLRAKIAALSKSTDALPALQAFVQRYPNDALTDDVLMWQAEVHARAGDHDHARRSLKQLLAQHADGDMADEARFLLAFSLVQSVDDADRSAGRALLESVASGRVHASILSRDRAAYWHARLDLFPSVDALTPNTDAAARSLGQAALAALFAARPASYYGVLANAVLVQAGVTVPMAPPQTLRRSALPIERPVPESLAADERVRTALGLVATGFDDEAALLVRDVVRRHAQQRQSLDTALFLSALAFRTGRSDMAHQVLRNSGHALLDDTPAKNPWAWSLAYPRASHDAIDAATSEFALSTGLLFGLAREESTFVESVVSWAGAVGLCQLMPTTAADEARDLKLSVPTVDELKAPSLNARLGAAHLARRLRFLKHPFLAIAAYNAGPGAVLSWNAKGPVDAWVERIPVDETRGYVKKVTGSWAAYHLLDGVTTTGPFGVAAVLPPPPS